jgi:perosamine synthetase
MKKENIPGPNSTSQISAEQFIPVCEPFLNGNELKYVTDAITTGWISSSGKYVTEFEKQFAAYCDCKYGVAVCNGTVSLHLALVALGIGKGDEVIIPTFTMIASAIAVCYTGAKPVFVDADEGSWNIDVSRIEEKITSRTKAIMPVHIFGQMCEMDKIKALAIKYNLFILEDAAEAHGAEYNSIKAGNYSDIASFSFFANKNLTTGEGGMLVTNNEELYNKARYFKNMCFPLDGNRNYTHNDIGFNYRMSNVIAAIGLAQVEKADEYKKLRIQNNQSYKKHLRNVPGIKFQTDNPGTLSVGWMNAIVINSDLYGHTKDELIGHLKENSIDTRLLFNGMHRQKCLEDFGCDCQGNYPVSDCLSASGLYLPSASNLTESQILHVCRIIISFGGFPIT